MILSTLAESGRVEHLHPAFKLVFDYVKSHDLTKVPAGRIALDGDRLFINVDVECIAYSPSLLIAELICQCNRLFLLRSVYGPC